MQRPGIKIQPEPIDRIIEVIGLIGLILLIGIPLLFFSEIPDTIPRHFGVDGTPDRFANKSQIWVLPIIGLVLYVGLLWTSKYPHLFNFPQKITEQNANKQYKQAVRGMRLIKVVLVWVLAYITYSTIQTAQGNQNGLGNYLIPVLIITVVGMLGYSLLQSTKKEGGK
ncbi:MAG: DUF1648 domain-containing protein [Saprospiraceae bacterium]|nr:DUF1648 domain-containing protein [Saprospiraceae bacterium]